MVILFQDQAVQALLINIRHMILEVRRTAAFLFHQLLRPPVAFSLDGFRFQYSAGKVF